MSLENDVVAQLTQENENLRREIESLKAKHQQLQVTLHSREAEVNALLGVQPHPVIARFDSDLRHTYVSAAVKLATGIPPEYHIGKTSREMGLPEKILPLWEGTMLEVFKKGAEKTIEYSVNMAQRKWTFQSQMVPEYTQPGVVTSVLVITRDITRQKRAELALLENYEILETIHRVGQALSGELDLQKLLQTVTDAAARL